MNNNKMICDLETGVCGEAGEDALETIDLNQPQKVVHVYYVTDPICSHCWALEPVLRQFEVQYGQYVKFHTVMGGLLAGWGGFADVKNGINNPADVAPHWREVGEHSRMPIDGSLWLNNPIQSSYPPSRVFKVIQQIDEQMAKSFLRRAREAVFAFNLNIGEDPVLIEIVNQIGLDGAAIVKEANLPAGQQLLDEDFALSKSLGVRGFPTIIMVNEENKGVKIVGARSLDNYVKGLQQALQNEAIQAKPIPALAELLEKETRLFSKEIEVMYDLNQNEVASFIQAELSPDAYTLKEILGEAYIEKR
ncbi:DsbA family protein [Paenibacillus eucommiae]|uniref:DsbA family dithiol-disulfide isomerase n=1 Tax=Paenibacillus eucommiae TaxID=1355755 RepID=A0ABS4IP52_9BACL|nr:DsbA family protein [Paenibacillus eucommiae]MBP1989334.1 putative DsbA family dithiol-disulfide isomerase [Paenibacillus eucommiae]